MITYYKIVPKCVFKETKKGKNDVKNKIEIFLDTQNWIKQDIELSLSVVEAKKNTEVFFEDDYPLFDRKIKNTTINISKDRSYQAAIRLSKQYSNKKIAVLSFANAFYPGGGVEIGATGQEECLCQTSTLYPLIYRHTLMETFYKHHKTLNTPKASDALIYTKGVIICKTDCDYPKRMPKEKWVTVDVITMAAPDLSSSNDVFMNDAELFGYHVKRAIHMFTVAAAQKADILVLGAFGCGVFGNNPKIVSNAYKMALSVFPKIFEHIEFAIYCLPNNTVNYDAFMECTNNIELNSNFDKTQLVSKNARLMGMNSILKEQNKELKDEVSKLKKYETEIRKITEENIKIKGIVSVFEKENEDLKNKIIELEEYKNLYENKYAPLKEENKRLKKRIDEAIARCVKENYCK